MTKKTETPKKIYVLFHANCFDGTGAKYAAWCFFHNAAEYIPVQYGKPFPSQVVLDKNSEVFILDFSYPREVLLDVESKVSLLKVLDHHVTAQADLAGLECAEFNMDKSGAVMAWEYFHPNTPIPTLLYHVQDGDLWKFEMENTEAVRAALPLLESNMKNWEWTTTSERSFSELVEKGKTILSFNKLKVDGAVKGNVKILPYMGYKVGVCNTTNLVSEIGQGIYLSKDLNVDFSITYFFDKDGVPFLSFRSTGDMDVSVLAKKLGGGGHKNAAGAKVTMEFISNLYKGIL